MVIGGVMFAWDSWHTLVSLIVGSAGIVAFGLYEYNLSAKASDLEETPIAGGSTQPIIRFKILGNSTLGFSKTKFKRS